MINPVLERIYLLLFVVVYYFFRVKPVPIDTRKKYNKFHLPVEIFILFSIFGNFFSVKLLGFNIRLVFILFIVYFFVFSFDYKIKLKLSKNQLYLVLFFVWVIASVLWININIGVQVRLVVTLMAIILLFIFNYYLSKYKDHSLLLNNLWRIGVVSAIIGIVEVVVHFTIGIKIPYPIVSRSINTSPTLLIRAFGAMDEPNWYGISLAIFFLIFLNSKSSGKKRYWFIFLLAILFAGNKVIFLSIIVMIYFYLKGKGIAIWSVKNTFILLFGVIIGLILMNVSIVKEVFVNRFASSLSYMASSSVNEIFQQYDRFVYIYYLFKGFLHSPIIGNGLNTGIYVQHVIPWYQKPISELSPTNTVGSSLFRILYEQGLIGMFLLAAFLKGIYSSQNLYFTGKAFVSLLYLVLLFYDFFPAIYGLPILLLLTINLSKSR